MKIEKHRTIDQISSLSRDQQSEFLKNESYLICKTDIGSYGVWEISFEDGKIASLHPHATFGILKDAIDYARIKENPILIEDGYQFIPIDPVRTVLLYQGFRASEILNALNEDEVFDGSPYQIGDTGVNAQIIHILQEGQSSVIEAQWVDKVDQMCSESLTDENFEKWEEVKAQLSDTRNHPTHVITEDGPLKIEQVSVRTKNAIIHHLCDRYGFKLPGIEERLWEACMPDARALLTVDHFKTVYKDKGRVRRLGKVGYIEIERVLKTYE